MPPVDPFFARANHAEALLWNDIGVGFLVAGLLRWRAPGPGRTSSAACLIAALLLIAFGWSDVVEVRTGAWWRPPWRLAWKGIRVLGLLVLAGRRYRGAKPTSPN